MERAAARWATDCARVWKEVSCMLQQFWMSPFGSLPSPAAQEIVVTTSPALLCLIMSVALAKNQSSGVTAGFPQPPGISAAWLPEIRDAEELCEVHERLRDALAQGQPRVGVGGDAAKFLRDGSLRIHANWLATGYYRLDKDCGVYRPTWKGAVLVTWRLLWPIKPLFRAWRRRHTSRLLHRLGIEV
jgi:hypothetical protein